MKYDGLFAAIKKLIQQEIPVEIAVGQIVSAQDQRGQIRFNGNGNVNSVLIQKGFAVNAGDTAIVVRPRGTSVWMAVGTFHNIQAPAAPTVFSNELVKPQNFRAIDDLIPETVFLTWDVPVQQSIVVEVQTASSPEGQAETVLKTRGSYAIIQSGFPFFARIRSVDLSGRHSGWSPWLHTAASDRSKTVDAKEVTFEPVTPLDWGAEIPTNVSEAINALSYLLQIPDVDYIVVNEIAEPAAPGSGTGIIYAKSDNKLYFKNDAGTEFDLTSTVSGGFTDLDDVPSSYSGQALKSVRVNSGATGLEFYTPATGDFLANGSVAMTGSFNAGNLNVLNVAYIEQNEASAPGTPSSGKGRIYVKTDSRLYFKNDLGTEYDLTASGGGGGDFYKDGSVAMTGDLNFGGKNGLDVDYFEFNDRASAPAAPGTGFGRLYMKATEKQLFFRNIDGEHRVSGNWLSRDGDGMYGNLNFQSTHSIENLKYLYFIEQSSSPGTPLSTAGVVFIKTDGQIYFKNDNGSEFNLTGNFRSDGSVSMSGDLNFNGNNATNINYGEFNEITAPGTPASGKGRLYVKSSDSKLYFKDDSGTEYDLTGAGAAYYQTVQNAGGTDQTQRNKLRFADGTGIDFVVTDDSGGNRTVVTPAFDFVSMSTHAVPAVNDLLAVYVAADTAYKSISLQSLFMYAENSGPGLKNLLIRKSVTDPGAPSADHGVIYIRNSDEQLYYKNDAGTFYSLTAYSLLRLNGTLTNARNRLNLIDEELYGINVLVDDDSVNDETEIRFRLDSSDLNSYTVSTSSGSDEMLIFDVSETVKPRKFSLSSLGQLVGRHTSFLDLSDTPDSLSGQANKLVRVNAGETALEFFVSGAGTGDFKADGSVSMTGTLNFNGNDGNNLRYLTFDHSADPSSPASGHSTLFVNSSSTLSLKFSSGAVIAVNGDFRADGSVSMTGLLNMGSNGIANAASLRLNEAAAPGTPPSGSGIFYVKTDSKPYFKSDGGVEYDLTAGSGASDFLGLTDTPNSYAGQSGKVAAVDGTETSLEFRTALLEFGGEYAAGFAYNSNNERIRNVRSISIVENAAPTAEANRGIIYVDTANDLMYLPETGSAVNLIKSNIERLAWMGWF
jgi:ribosomal protein L24E